MFGLDYQSRLPFYEQLYNSVIRMVSLGVLQPDEQLPTVRGLAQELGINPSTVQKAYQMLERDGITYSVTGRGSFIAPESAAADRRGLMLRELLQKPLVQLTEAGFSKEEILSEVQSFFQKGGTIK